MFFYFKELEKKEIQKEIHKLKNNKAAQHSEFPPKLLRATLHIFRDFLYVSINSPINSSLFPSCLKTVDITLIFKKIIIGL